MSEQINTIEFKTSAQQICYEKVSKWLQQIFGEMAFPVSESTGFIVLGNTGLISKVYVSSWGTDDATVCVRSYIVTGAEINSDLTSFLLKENANKRFGAFGLDDDNDIFFDYTVVGNSLDKETLKATVIAVLQTAAQCEEIIILRWGGNRATY